jgi:hypothetical protein
MFTLPGSFPFSCPSFLSTPTLECVVLKHT